MKKFIAGFVCGGLLFGGITVFAADLKGALFNIDNVVVDGKKITIHSKNKPFTFQGYAYFPSYMLKELGFQPSRSSDGKTVNLDSTGQINYPTDLNSTIQDAYLISALTRNNSNMSSDIAYESTNRIKARDGLLHSNYIYFRLNEVAADSKVLSDMSFALKEKYQVFKTSAELITRQQDHIPQQPITLSIFLTDNTGQKNLFKSYSLSKDRLTADIVIPLRYMDEVSFTVTGTGEAGELAMINPIFIK